MKRLLLLLLVLFLIIGCSNTDTNTEQGNSIDQPTVEDESVPEDSVESPGETEQSEETSVPDVDEQDIEEAAPENIENEPEKEEAEETEPEEQGEKDYDALCDTEIPSDAEFIDEQYGSSHVTYYKTKTGEFIGPYWKYYDSQKTMRLSFRCYDEEGEKTGPVTDWDKEGNIEEEYFLKDGSFDGPYRIYYDGVLVEDMNYEDGQEQGVWTFYSDDGVIKRVEEYLDGVRHGIWKTYDDGNIRMEQEYDMGVKTPNIKMYYDDGSIQSERKGKTVDNKFTGTYTTYDRPDENGDQAAKECTFIAGVVQECREV